jgi:hypothetical protein
MANKLPRVVASALARAGMSARQWASQVLAPANEIRQGDSYAYGTSPATIASLLGAGRRTAQSRNQIYEKWEFMLGDAVVSSAVGLLVTTALGGHETTGDVIFIETRPDAEKDKRLAAIVEEIRNDLSPLFNRIAYPVAFTGAGFGDAYTRNYFKKGKGLTDIYTGEMVRPPLVQPYEKGDKTIGYEIFVGPKQWERLRRDQMTRFKMPRLQWVPQQGVTQKWIHMAIAEDDVDDLPHMPAMVGGSLLYPAEEPYDNLYATLLGLVGQRWNDSIDEQILTANLGGMTGDQQKRFLNSVITMLKTSKERAEKAVKDGRPVMERIRHILPVFDEKQLTSIGPANGGASGRPGTISIEDVLFHAKLLAGAFGVDLSMLGFADLLSGGLGEGGFFRTSAQAAERARIIRGALADFFNDLIDVHTYYRYGVVFPETARPWSINFYGSISALETERQKTKMDAMNAGSMLVTTMQQLKDMGVSEGVMKLFLSKQMLVDEGEAAEYAKIVNIKPPDGEIGGGPGMGSDGGFGGES